MEKLSANINKDEFLDALLNKEVRVFTDEIIAIKNAKEGNSYQHSEYAGTLISYNKNFIEIEMVVFKNVKIESPKLILSNKTKERFLVSRKHITSISYEK